MDSAEVRIRLRVLAQLDDLQKLNAQVIALQSKMADTVKAANSAGSSMSGAFSGVKGSIQEAINAISQGNINIFSSFKNIVANLGQSLGALGPVAEGAGLAIAAIGVVAIAAGGAIFELAKKAADYGATIYETSVKSGISTQYLGTLKVAADASNMSFEELNMGLKFLNRNVGELSSGKSTEATRILQAFGFNAKDAAVQSGNLDKILPIIAGRFQEIGSASVRNAVAIALFGRGAQDIIPFFKNLSEHTDEYTRIAKEMGIVLSKEDAEASHQFKVQLSILQEAILGTVVTIGKEFMPQIKEIVVHVTNWIAKNHELIAQDIKGFVHGVGVVIGAVVDVIGGIIDVIRAFSDALSSLFSQISKWVKEALDQVAKWALDFYDKVSKVTNKMAEWGKAHLGLGEDQDKNRKILEQMTGQTNLFQQTAGHAAAQTNVLAASTTSSTGTIAKHNEKIQENSAATAVNTKLTNDLNKAIAGGEKATEEHAKKVAELNQSIHERIILLQAELQGMGTNAEVQAKLNAQKEIAQGADKNLVNNQLQLVLVQAKVNEYMGTTTDKLKKQLAEFGKSPTEIAKYETSMALAYAAAHNMNQGMLDWIKSWGQLREEVLGAEKLKNITEAFMPEQDKLKLKAQQDLAILDDFWKQANDPTVPLARQQRLLDILTQIGISNYTDYENRRTQITQDTENKILEIQKQTEDKVKLTYDDLMKAHQLFYTTITQQDISAILTYQLDKIDKDTEITINKIKQDFKDPVIQEGLISDVTAKANIARLEQIRQAELTLLLTSGKVTDAIKAGMLQWADAAGTVSKQISDYITHSLDQIGSAVSKMATDVFHGQFKNILSDWKSLLSQMLDDFLALVVRIAEQKIVISLAGSLGLSSGAQAGGLGSLISPQGIGGIFSGLGSIFGGGAGATGALLGSSALAAGQIGLDVSSAGMGFLGSIGSVIGTIAPFAAAAMVAIPLIGGILDLFKKQPYVEFDVAHLQSTDLKRYATMADFMVAVADTSGEMAKKLVKGWEEHGAGVRTQPIRDAILKNVQDLLITPVQTAIDTLPKDIADKIKQAFLTTPIVYHGAQLTMNEVGDAISQAIQSFVSGQATAQIEAAMKDFWKTALVDMGVEAKKASDLIDAELKGFWSSKNQADIGKQIVAQFQAYVQAFNLASGNMTDTFQTAVNSLISLAQSLGFKGIPTMQEFSDKLKEMIANAQITPDVIAKFQQLHDAIISLNLALSQSILTISQAISALNAKIVALGGASVDISNQVQQSINQLQNLITQGGLTPEQMQQALQTMTGLVDEWVAAQEAAQAKVLKAQEASVQSQIDSLNNLKTKTQETYQKEIDATQKALDLANSYKQLNDSIKATLQGILTGSVTPMTPIEQVNLLQSQIQAAKAGLAGAKTDTAKQEYITQIQTLSQQLIQSAGTAFGVGSPAFQAIFTQVTKDLQSLINLTGAKSADIAELTKKIVDLNKQMNDKLAAIDKQIAADNAKLTALQAQETQLTGAAKAEAKAYYQFIETQYMAMLQKQIAQQAQIGTATTYTIDTGFTSLISVNNQMLTGINQIVKNTSAIGGGIPKFQHGGYVERTGLAYVHQGEYVMPPRGNRSGGNVNLAITMEFKGMDVINVTPDTWNSFVIKKLMQELDHGGKIREKIERLHRYAT